MSEQRWTQPDAEAVCSVRPSVAVSPRTAAIWDVTPDDQNTTSTCTSSSTKGVDLTTNSFEDHSMNEAVRHHLRLGHQLGGMPVGLSTEATAGAGDGNSVFHGETSTEGEDEIVVDFHVPQEQERKINWLSMEKQAAESLCRGLERKLAEAREAGSKQEISLRVAQRKISQLEAENKGLLAEAEFREKEASMLQAGTQEAQERAQAHERALANALEQLSDSGVSESKKLAELAEVTAELKRTKAALERAERIVFDQRQEADRKLFEENRRRAETDALRGKLSHAERKNTELLTKQATGRLGKKVRGNFARSSTFCASFCSCFRGRPAYRRVTSVGGIPVPPTALNRTSTLPVDSPWLT